MTAGDQTSPEIIQTVNGTWVFSFINVGVSVYVRIFYNNGSAITDDVLDNSGVSPRLLGFPDGNFHVIFVNSASVYLQKILGSNGTKIGSLVEVKTSTVTPRNRWRPFDHDSAEISSRRCKWRHLAAACRRRWGTRCDYKAPPGHEDTGGE